MTPVPVVSTPLNTRTEREVLNFGGWFPFDCIELDWSALVRHAPDRTRERLVADPAFVVLPEVPDLTCRDCGGSGGSCILIHDGSPHGRDYCRGAQWRDCPSCGGSGVPPVYDATWQALDDDGDWYTPGLPLTKQDVESFPNESRQLVEWRARRVEPLPVVDANTANGEETCVYLYADGEASILTTTPITNTDVTNEPWAADLQPDMCVLRLSDWEHLEQPYTETVCGCNAGRSSDWGDDHAPCGGSGYVPLSVPDGVLSWMELA